MAERHDGVAVGAAGMLEAEKIWRRVMGEADLPELVATLRRLDLARTTPAPSKRAAQHRTWTIDCEHVTHAGGALDGDRLWSAR